MISLYDKIHSEFPSSCDCLVSETFSPTLSHCNDSIHQ